MEIFLLHVLSYKQISDKRDEAQIKRHMIKDLKRVVMAQLKKIMPRVIHLDLGAHSHDNF